MDPNDTTANRAGPNRFEEGKWLSALIALLGLWMIGQAIVLDLADAHLWNDALVGVLLIAVGGYNYTRRADERFGSVPAAIVAAAAGLWLIATPFVLGDDPAIGESMAVWNDIIVGLIALGLGAYSAYRAREVQEEPRPATP